MKYEETNKNFYKWLLILTGSIGGLILLSLWSFFEASIWFIAPDFLIALYCFINPNKYKKYLLYASLFSLLGGIFYYMLVFNFPVIMEPVLQNTPFVSEAGLNLIRGFYSDYGVYGTLFQSITFKPFKMWTYLAIAGSLNVYLYFIFVFISRLFRFFLVALIAMLVSKFLKKYLSKHMILVLIVYTLLFLGATYILDM